MKLNGDAGPPAVNFILSLMWMKDTFLLWVMLQRKTFVILAMNALNLESFVGL